LFLINLKEKKNKNIRTTISLSRTTKSSSGTTIDLHKLGTNTRNHRSVNRWSLERDGLIHSERDSWSSEIKHGAVKEEEHGFFDTKWV
jgi:hypothetical protein